MKLNKFTRLNGIIFLMSLFFTLSADTHEKNSTNHTTNYKCSPNLPILTKSVGRKAFEKKEANASYDITITNKSAYEIQLEHIESNILFKRKILNNRIKRRGKITISIPLKTNLKPNLYKFKIKIIGSNKKKCQYHESNLSAHITKRNHKEYMPVILWGEGDKERLKSIGFTSDITRFTEYKKIWKKGTGQTWNFLPKKTKALKELDEYLISGIRNIIYVYPARWLTAKPNNNHYLDNQTKDSFRRKNVSGVSYKRINTDASLHKVKNFTKNTGTLIGSTYASHPAVIGALLHSETRAYTNISHTNFNKLQYKKFSGKNIPKNAINKNGIKSSKSRIIEDNDPLREYYEWFWKYGDGWNELNTILDTSIKSTSNNRGFFTFTDPSLRTPSIWGSGGNVDYLSHWTYSYPEPLKISLAAEELFAMSEGNSDQDVMQMTQIIWKNWEINKQSKMTKLLKKAQKRKNEFLTIAPDNLEETFWLKISYPIKGIMYHGWESLVGGSNKFNYRMTNAKSEIVLKNLISNIIKPLGATLINIPDKKPDIAVLECFTSQIYKQKKDYGYGKGWGADSYFMARWAQLQTKVIYEETLLEHPIEQYKAIFVNSCDITTKSIIKKLISFQKKGGIIIGDENTPTPLIPNIVLPKYNRTGLAKKDKEQLLQKAKYLRSKIDSHYTRHIDTDNPNIITRVRSIDNTDYIFLANDHRTYGNYVGNSKVVMEKGLPSSGTITINRKNVYLYDLVSHSQVTQITTINNKTNFNVSLAPGKGGIYLVSEDKIQKLKSKHKNSVKQGETLKVSISIFNTKNMKIKGIIPIKISIIDANKTEHESTGYYSAKHGKLIINVDIAENDPQGKWQIKVSELASNKDVHSFFSVIN